MRSESVMRSSDQRRVRPVERWWLREIMTSWRVLTLSRRKNSPLASVQIGTVAPSGIEQAFTVIHLASGFKVDIFSAANEFQQGQIHRATRLGLPGGLHIPVAIAEDLFTPTAERLP